MKKLLSKVFDSWIGWIIFVIIVRIIIGGIIQQNPQKKISPTNQLLKVALDNKDQEKRKLAFDALYEAASRSPEQHKKIYLTLKQKYEAKKQPKDVKKFIAKLENSPETILREALKSFSLSTIEQISMVTFWLVVGLAILFTSIIPILLFFFVHKSSIRKVFGKLSYLKLFFYNSFLYGLLVTYFWWPTPVVYIQGGLGILVLLIFHYIERSKTLAIFLGIVESKMKKPGQVW